MFIHFTLLFAGVEYEITDVVFVQERSPAKNKKTPELAMKHTVLFYFVAENRTSF